MAKSQVNVYSLKGEVVKTVELPKVFETAYRPDVIHRAIVAEEANCRQPYGSKPGAGTRHAVSTWGKGRGVARVQRLTQGSKAAESPNNIGGRRAFPPLAEKDFSKKVNRKERILARYSAMAAVGNVEMVRARGHKFADKVTVPVVVEDAFEGLKTTADVLGALQSIGLDADVDRAKDGKKVRPGKGKMRGRRFKSPRGILIIVSNAEASVFDGASNLAGVEVAVADKLSTGKLAPGGMPGRLTVFSEAALAKIGAW
jgi:large subunit ribosomal protein L4e